MKKFKKLSAIVASMLLLVSISLIQSCKDKENPTPTPKPEITSISPAKAKVGATITITGKNFKAGTEGVSVKVEGVAATVTSATLTSIVCVVPTVAVGPADVIVNINSIASVAYNSFEVLEGNVNAPEITSISPTTALPGASVTITGLYFKEGITGVSVTFADTEATLTSATTTSIVCTVPQITAGAADVIVTVDGQASAAFTGFTVEQGISISDFEPKRGRFDTIITLTGEKFGTVKTAVKVTVNGKEQEITEITDTQLKIKLAKKTWSGAVKVEKDGVIATATQELEYINTYTKGPSISKAEAIDLAIDSKGKIYATIPSFTQSKILQMDSDGNVIHTIDLDKSIGAYPHGLFIDNNDRVYFTSQSTGKIYTFESGSSDIDTILSNNAITSGEFKIAYISGDNKGYLFVGTYGDSSVARVNIATKSIERIYKSGGRTYGVQQFNNALYFNLGVGLEKVNSDGTNHEIINDKIKFNYTNIKLSSQGHLYALGYDNRKLYTLDKENNLIEVLNIDQGVSSINPRSLAENAVGDLYIAFNSSTTGILKVIVE